MGARTRLAVFCSGGGSNLQALLDATGQYDIVVVVCNVPGALAIARAEESGVPTVVISHKGFPSRGEFETELLAALCDFHVDAVALAGFMRILSGAFLQELGVPVINVHPSLLPNFPGMHAARQAIEAGVEKSGCTVHLVDSGVDTGSILAQADVDIHADDTAETLQAKIQREEHRLFPQVINDIATGKLCIAQHETGWRVVNN